MAVTQEGGLRQPPEAAQPGHMANSASTLPPAPSSQVQQPAPSRPAPPMAGTPGQAPGPELTFDQFLERQITQAIQPVLDEFRQNMTQAMQQPPQRAPAPPAPTDGHGPRQQAPPERGVQPPSQQPATAAQAGIQQAQTPLPPPAQPALAGVLAPAAELTSQQGEQWLQSWLATGLAVLLAESSRAVIQRRAEQGLHLLLEKLFTAMPDGAGNQEMRAKAEQTLQAMLRETLGAVFTDAVRTTLLREGQTAIESAVHGDVGALLGVGEETLKAMMEALATALRGQRQRVLRLVLALVLLALEGSLLESDHHARSS